MQLVDIMRANQSLQKWTQDCKEYEQKQHKKENKEKKKDK
jgi:hypothetical protein